MGLYGLQGQDRKTSIINICAKTITSTFDDLIRKIVKHYINKFRNRNSRTILINLYIFSSKKANINISMNLKNCAPKFLSMCIRTLLPQLEAQLTEPVIIFIIFFCKNASNTSPIVSKILHITGPFYLHSGYVSIFCKPSEDNFSII